MSSTDFFDGSLRADIRLTLVGKGIPAAFVGEIVDIACHAAQSGYDAMARVIDGHPDPRVQMTAHGIAGSLLETLMKTHREVLVKHAEERGVPVHNAQVSFGERA